MEELPMADVLDELFKADDIARFRARINPSRALTQRIDVLTAAEMPDAPLSDRSWQRVLLATRAAWVDYVSSMRIAGLLDADVVGRLMGVDDDGFRSALAECLTSHFLTRILGLEIFGRREGRPGTAIDFGVRRGDGDISLEVKSPFRERPAGTMWSNDYAHILQPALDEANRQFAEGCRNVLVLAPLVEFPVLSGRMSYVKAFFGETNIVFEIDKKTGRALNEPAARFVTEGKFLKLWPEPRFTRTGAVVALRERRIEENQLDENFCARVELCWFVMHNPHCPVPVPVDIWGNCAQLVRDGDAIRWTDGGPIDGSLRKRG
jgi:hypothetical protein